jgi:hypothetical protein
MVKLEAMTDDADEFETLWFGITRDEIRALSCGDQARFLAAVRRRLQAPFPAGEEISLSGRVVTAEDEQKAAQARRRRAERRTRAPEVPPNTHSAS